MYLAYRIQIRNGLASEWVSANPVLMEGELAIEKDTRKFKIGNGINNWNALPYATQGEKGEKGDTGEKGQAFVYADFTPQQLLNLKGEKGDIGETGLRGLTGETGKGLQFTWNGTKLGVRVEGTTTYNYIELKGEKGDKGDTGSVENLTASHITNALGFTIKNLSNVDNLKQMPISDGVLENYTEKLTTTTGPMNLSLGNVFYRNVAVNTTFVISNPKAQSHSFTLYINMGSVVRTLTFPSSVKWQGGTIPDMTVANKTYILVFSTINSGVTWFASGSDY